MRQQRRRCAIGVAMMFVGTACTAPAAALSPSATAARSFRPVSALFFLPERAPTTVRDAALVPDSKILWDLQVTAKSLGLTAVGIEVHGQQVIVDGSVPSDEARATLLDVARRTPGVRSVTGAIEVRP